MANPISTSFFDEINKALQQVKIINNTESLWLGAGAGPDGGTGSRPGGFIGYLPQTRVAYDTTEASKITGSGSLLDNLNHIRYNIDAINDQISSGVATVGGDTHTHIHALHRVVVSSGTTIINLPDEIEDVWQVSNNGFIVDPVDYTPSQTTITFTTQITETSTIVVQYTTATE